MVKSQKEDFTHYMASVLQNSMLTGIPQIASAANAPKKAVRALVFLLCMAGFIYQSKMFMDMYFEYKTILDVQVSNPKHIELPSMTICNFNGFQLSKVCYSNVTAHLCNTLSIKNQRKWCRCLPRYCDGNGTTVIKRVLRWHESNQMARWKYEEYEPYLQTLEDLVPYCGLYFSNINSYSLIECDLSYYKNIRCPTVDVSQMTACYTINTLLGRPDGVPKEVLASSFLVLMMDLQPIEYNTKSNKVQAQVAFHHPRTVINPYVEGFTMLEGKETVFRLKKVVKKLLPPPYETNCMDYMALWRARGGEGPTNERECIQECNKNESLRLNGCVDGFYQVATNDVICGVASDSMEVLQASQICASKNCRPACYEESYVVTRDEKELDNAKVCGVESEYDGKTMINLRFDGMETTSYIYSPKFQNIETFSYVGGYVGMWLGISLVAVFDFLETVVVILRYPCRSYMAYRTKKDRIKHIQKTHRALA